MPTLVGDPHIGGPLPIAVTDPKDIAYHELNGRLRAADVRLSDARTLG
jgi:hypothetical protein